MQDLREKVIGEEVYLARGRCFLAGGVAVVAWWSTMKAVGASVEVKKLSRRKRKQWWG
jgi:hypothetical protein